MKLLYHALPLALLAILGACGGGGGRDSAQAPIAVTPPATGGPSPAPLPPTVTYPSAPSGITGPTDFVLLGSFSAADFVPTLAADDLALRWLGQPATYRLKVNGVGEGELQQNSMMDPAMKMVGSSGQTLLGGIDVPRPMGRYSGLLASYGSPSFRVAFGQPTAATSIPTTGMRAYRNLPGDVGYAIRLNVDYATRQVSGEIEISWTDAWGPYPPTTYTIAPGVIASGSTEFELTINTPGTSSPGKLLGRFAGPTGEELMLTWRAEVRNPYDNSWVPYAGIKILGT